MLGSIVNISAQQGPYKDEAINKVYNLLFCDNIQLLKENTSTIDQYPWNILFTGSNDELINLVNKPGIETRVKILAYNQLRINGCDFKSKELLAVIVEVPLENGLDVVACYSDGTARYLNQSGKIIVWETNEDIQIENTIKELFDKARIIYSTIGPWDKDRLSYPKNDLVRITLLASDGFYFGQGPMNLFFNDSLAAPTLNSTTKLLQLLISKTQK